MIPPKGLEVVLTELHEGHPGINKNKSLIRMYMWWLRIDKDIEESVNCYIDCQMFQSVPPVAPLQP